MTLFKAQKNFLLIFLWFYDDLRVATKKTVTETGLCILFTIVIFGKKLHQLQ